MASGALPLRRPTNAAARLDCEQGSDSQGVPCHMASCVRLSCKLGDLAKSKSQSGPNRPPVASSRTTALADSVPGSTPFVRSNSAHTWGACTTRSTPLWLSHVVRPSLSGATWPDSYPLVTSTLCDSPLSCAGIDGTVRGAPSDVAPAALAPCSLRVHSAPHTVAPPPTVFSRLQASAHASALTRHQGPGLRERSRRPAPRTSNRQRSATHLSGCGEVVPSIR